MVIADEFILAYGPPDTLPRYTLYPATPEETLAFQFKVTSWAETKFEPGFAPPAAKLDAADVDGIEEQPEKPKLAAIAATAISLRNFRAAVVNRGRKLSFKDAE